MCGSGVKGLEDANGETEHEQRAGAKVARKMASLVWNKGHEVSPSCAAVRPEGEESPVGGVDCRHERPDTVDLGDVARDDGKNIGR